MIQYFDAWIENDDCLYIQMELCSDNLQNIIQQKPDFFGRNESEPMKPIEYYISGQIFKELLECVQYLHESNPPVIHGNLKMENVLICDIPRNGRFLKLCDIKIKKQSESDEVDSLINDIYCLADLYQKIFNR